MDKIIKTKSLDEKYAFSILIYLLGNFPEGVMLSDLLKNITNTHKSITNVLEMLERDRLVYIIKNASPSRENYIITLTKRGEAVAKLLKLADEIAEEGC